LRDDLLDFGQKIMCKAHGFQITNSE